MRINFISTQNNNTKPAFKGTDLFNTVKTLPGMICSICGKKTIANDVYVKTITPLAKPLAYNMNKGVLNYIERKYPLVWAKLKDFADRFPKLSLDEILEEYDTYVELKQSVVETLEPEPVPHDTPERIELDRSIGKVFFDTLDNARSYMKSSSTVIKQLLNLKEYLGENQKEIFEQLEIYSRKYPRKSISEIINLPEIHKFHSTKNILQRIETREKLDYHFENIRNLIKKKNPKAVEAFDELKEKALDLYETEKDEKARAYYIQEMYTAALKEHGCESIQEEVLAELNRIPITFNSKDSFLNFAYNHEYTDYQIIKVLFNGLLASEDHMTAISEGGKDVIENKSVMHRSCNSKRGSKPYSEIVKYHTGMPEHTQKQMDLITEKILDGTLSLDLKFYPIKAAENYLRESGGSINLDIVKYCEKGLELSENRVNNNESNISSLIAQKQAINQQISEFVDSNRTERNLQNRMKEYLEKFE